MSEADVISGKTQLNYNANDWFYMNRDKCGQNVVDCVTNADHDCCKNKSAVRDLQSVANGLGASATQYNDSKVLYSRELLFTVNILVGLAMICYYIYLNQDVLPDPGAALIGLGNTVVNAAKDAAKDATKGAIKT
jgi:hypothetical protein